MREMTSRRSRRGRNSSAEIAAKTGPLQNGEGMRDVQHPGDRAAVVWVITCVIVVRSDPVPKQEVNVDRSRTLLGGFGHDMEGPIDEHPAPMKEDTPWNPCC